MTASERRNQKLHDEYIKKMNATKRKLQTSQEPPSGAPDPDSPHTAGHPTPEGSPTKGGQAK